MIISIFFEKLGNINFAGCISGAFRSHNFYDFFHKKIELLEIMSNFGISMDHVGKCRLIGHTQ